MMILMMMFLVFITVSPFVVAASPGVILLLFMSGCSPNFSGGLITS